MTNEAIATALEQVADRLTEYQANPHRIRAYRTAAQNAREAEQPLSTLLEEGGLPSLKALPGIGERLALHIAGLLQTGHLRQLKQIEQAFSPTAFFTRVPGIGEVLAQRIYDVLRIKTLEALELATYDGRLAEVEGFGQRRVRALRNQLNALLSHQSRRRAWRYQHIDTDTSDSPSVAMLLNVDQEYRHQSKCRALRTIAPRRFNASGAAWLPILETRRNRWRFTALFSNTARAHELGKTNDWVVIYGACIDQEQQYTVVTETRGLLQGKRVVRGREPECRAYYQAQQASAA